MNPSADPHEDGPDGSEALASFIPTEADSTTPAWLEGFHLTDLSLLIRRIELEVQPSYLCIVDTLFHCAKQEDTALPDVRVLPKAKRCGLVDEPLVAMNTNE